MLVRYFVIDLAHNDHRKIDARIPAKDLDFIDRLIASRVFRNRSAFIRYAVTEAKSKYTNEPTLTNLAQRLDRQKARLDQIERKIDKM